MVKKRRFTLRYWLNLLAFTVILLSVALYGIFPLALAYSYTRPSRHTVDTPTPAEYGMKYEAVELTAADGFALRGWYIPPQNGAVILLYPGYGGDRRSVLAYASLLSKAGYGSLLMDPRATGESDGDVRAYGWDDWADAAAAVDWLEKRDEVLSGHIGSMGCSTGAEIALGAAALDGRIKAVVSDAPYYAAMEDFSRPATLEDWLGWPLYPVMLNGIRLFSGVRPPMSLVDAVESVAPRPLLLIAGEQSDRGFEALQAQHYLQHAGENADLWVIPQANHCAGLAVAPKEYAQRVTAFFNSAFNLP